jgi:VIT1/CCC1 family predicted Fe2+/Mn2+ transporter
MLLEPIRLNTVEEFIKARDELLAYFQCDNFNGVPLAKQLVVSTDGHTYLLFKLLMVKQDEAENCPVKFLAVDGKSYSLTELLAAYAKDKAAKETNAKIENEKNKEAENHLEKLKLTPNRSLAESLKMTQVNNKSEMHAYLEVYTDNCAINRNRLLFPVITPSGYSYEQGNLNKWIEYQNRLGHHTDPISNRVLEVEQINHNHALRDLVKLYYSQEAERIHLVLKRIKNSILFLQKSINERIGIINEHKTKKRSLNNELKEINAKLELNNEQNDQEKLLETEKNLKSQLDELNESLKKHKHHLKKSASILEKAQNQLDVKKSDLQTHIDTLKQFQLNILEELRKTPKIIELKNRMRYLIDLQWNFIKKNSYHGIDESSRAELKQQKSRLDSEAKLLKDKRDNFSAKYNAKVNSFKENNELSGASFCLVCLLLGLSTLFIPGVSLITGVIIGVLTFIVGFIGFLAFSEMFKPCVDSYHNKLDKHYQAKLVELAAVEEKLDYLDSKIELDVLDKELKEEELEKNQQLQVIDNLLDKFNSEALESGVLHVAPQVERDVISSPKNMTANPDSYPVLFSESNKVDSNFSNCRYGSFFFDNRVYDEKHAEFEMQYLDAELETLDHLDNAHSSTHLLEVNI